MSEKEINKTFLHFEIERKVNRKNTLNYTRKEKVGLCIAKVN